MKTFATLLALAILPIAVPLTPARLQDSATTRPAEPGWVTGNSGDALAQLVFFAVLEGCYRDGVANSTVDALLMAAPGTETPEIFVYACPICFPALDALRLYRRRQPFFAMKGEPDTFGAGLAAAVKSDLESSSAWTRRAAWGTLFESWIEQRLTNLRLTPVERQAIETGLQYRKKIGTTLLEQYKASDRPLHHGMMKACPSCDGAAEAAKPKER